LENILANRRYTEYFVRHLVKEFSVECILAYFEMRQFAYLLYTKSGVVFANTAHYEKFAEHIPRSSIIFNDKQEENQDEMRRWKAMFVAIYNKYIIDGAEFCLNVSGALRSEYDEVMSAHESSKGWQVKNVEEMMAVFNPIMDEIKFMMEDSLYRFSVSPEFQVIYDDKV